MRHSPVFIPADIPTQQHTTYLHHYNLITKNTGRLLMLSADQKIEHLNADFAGEHIHPDAQDPEHVFRIAQQGSVGALATQLGLIAQYGAQYQTIPYIIKVNSKTNLIPKEAQDPYSGQLYTIDEIVQFAQESVCMISGVGYTVYVGSEFEQQMLQEAAQIVFEAHQQGLVAILWMYPRGKHITHERDPQLIAGVAGIAACLGADFTKIHAPISEPASRGTDLERIVAAAGKTKVICSGGPQRDPQQLFSDIQFQLKHGIMGAAIGRNIFQHSLDEAVEISKSLAAIVYR